MSVETYMLYITAKDGDEAARVGKALVERRLAACANIIDGITSVYWWEGEVHQDSEAILIAKTQKARLDEAIAAVREIHSYECPCVVAIPIAAGNPAFLDWIRTETTPNPQNL